MSERTLTCPRDGTSALQTVSEHGIEIDRCPACRGAWYDYGELATLEQTAASAEYDTGMIEYAKRQSTLRCPAGGEEMVAFNYRAYNLELDACPAEHGFWLDEGEAQRVTEIMRERVRGLQRGASAQAAWDRAKSPASGGVMERMRNLFRGR